VSPTPNRPRFPTFDQATLLGALDWAYQRAVDGAAGMDGAAKLAESYRKVPGSADEQAKKLVRMQVTLATSAGFVASFGGVFTLPVAVPANLAAVLFIQLRMIAGVAVLGGHDVKTEQVKSMAYACLCGSIAHEIVGDVGKHVGATLSARAMRSASFEVLKKLNQVVQARLLAKLGETGVLSAGRLVPIAGGLLGGSLDGISTYSVGRAARSLFTDGLLDSIPDSD
jgi:hypothetical protein